jgi:protein O-mannosyl-transferase
MVIFKIRIMSPNNKNTGKGIPPKSIIICLLIVVPLLVFGPAGKYGFVGWDDDIHVYNNRYIGSLTPGNIIHFWASPHEAMYIPVTFTAWSFLAALSRLVSPGGIAFGLNPGIFHQANIFLHICNILLLYGILKLLLRGSSKDPARIEWAACLGALLYGIHPLQAEPVIWISSLKDVLCGFFSLLALNQYIRYVRAVEINRALPAVNRRQRKRHGIYAVIFYILAILSKAAAVPLAVIGWLLVHFRWRDSELTGRKNCFQALARPPFAMLLLWLGIALPVIYMAKFSEQSIPLGYVAPLYSRVLIALDALAFYLYKLILPLNIGIDYGRTPVRIIENGWLYYSWIFPVLLTGFLLFLKARRRWLIILGIFVVGVFPTLGLVPHGYQIFSTVADRFLYLSMIAPALALSWIFLQSRKVIISGICIAVVIIYSAAGIIQTKYWAGNLALFRHALDVNPASYMAHYNLGLTLAGEGSPAAAIDHYQRAIEIKPDYGRAHNNLGAILTEQGEYLPAISHYAEAFRLDPGNGRAFFNLYSAHNDLGIRLADRGDLTGAIIHYREAIRVNPNYADAYSNLGNALAAGGELEDAAEQYRQALRIKPDFAMAANNLGIALIRQGKTEEAIESFSRALRINPGFTRARKNLELAHLEMKKPGS